MIYNGDCIEVLRTLPDNSVDSLVTDPPAGISFMGKDWDHHKGGRKQWTAWMAEVMTECLRVMKPGAHGLVWALPRTSHWTGSALEDAGFEVRDVVSHLFGTGFPKSMNLKKAGAGDAWEGYGTALKPAHEMWFLVRKPISEKTVASNVLKWGVGGLNIDGCRIEVSSSDPNHRKPSVDWKNANTPMVTNFGSGGRPKEALNLSGRFPANLVLSHNPDCEDDQCSLSCAAAMLDAQSGPCKTGDIKPGTLQGFGGSANTYGSGRVASEYKSDSATGASRFFYCAKISTSERNAGLVETKNVHPTVKAQRLMRYLCRLITPPNGVVLDPFMGSGSTGVAAKSESFKFIGIEIDPEYVEIAKKRIGSISNGN